MKPEQPKETRMLEHKDGIYLLQVAVAEWLLVIIAHL